MIDFVFPCHEKDIVVLDIAINNIKTFFPNSNIYLISPTDLKIKNTIQYFDNQFNNLFTLEQIKNKWSSVNNNLAHRSHWIYQQLLKLHCQNIIFELKNNYVVIDADCIFLKHISFKENVFYYNVANEYHKPYITTYNKIMKNNYVPKFSFISHHMIFNKNYLNEMINSIQNIHNKKFVEVLLDCIDYNENSSFSEWDLYGNWMILNHSDVSEHRQLNWIDLPFIPDKNSLKQLSGIYDFVCPHAWMRGIE